MKKRFMLLLCVFLPISFPIAHDCVTIPFNALRMLAESRIDPCPICQKKLQRQALAIIAKEVYPERKIIFTTSCNLVKNQHTKDNELMLITGYDTKVTINGTETNLPYVIFKFYTHENHIVGIDEKDYSTKEIQNIYKSLLNDTPVEAEIVAIAYKYNDFASTMYIPERNALIIHCKIVQLKQKQ